MLTHLYGRYSFLNITPQCVMVLFRSEVDFIYASVLLPLDWGSSLPVIYNRNIMILIYFISNFGVYRLLKSCLQWHSYPLHVTNEVLDKRYLYRNKLFSYLFELKHLCDNARMLWSVKLKPINKQVRAMRRRATTGTLSRWMLTTEARRMERADVNDRVPM